MRQIFIGLIVLATTGFLGGKFEGKSVIETNKKVAVHGGCHSDSDCGFFNGNWCSTTPGNLFEGTCNVANVTRINEKK